MSGYGTVSHNSHTNGHGTHEEDALLPRKDHQPAVSEKLYRHLNVDVERKNGDLILLLCYVVTGLLDSCATAVWGSFVSMQTGNTVYFGLGLSSPSASTRWIKSGTSIVAFCAGSFCFARFHRYFSPRKRWVLTASFVFQLLLIVGAAIITMIYRKSTEPEHELQWHTLVPLAMIAFQSSGQAVTSRALQFSSLTSVVLTSIYCDLFSDAKLFTWPSENAERNRRVAAPILVVIGALFGGLWSKTEIGLAGALWTAAFLKAIMVFAWLTWRAEPAMPDHE